MAIICLGPRSPAGSSTLPAAQSRRAASRCIFGLAGGGVCRAANVTIRAVRSYRTFSPFPRKRRKAEPADKTKFDVRSLKVAALFGVRSFGVSPAVCFLWHFPAAYAGLVLPTTVPCPVRTFLPEAIASGEPRSPDRVDLRTHGRPDDKYPCVLKSAARRWRRPPSDRLRPLCRNVSIIASKRHEIEHQASQTLDLARVNLRGSSSDCSARGPIAGR